MNEDMVEASFDWISEMRAGNLRIIVEVPNHRNFAKGGQSRHLHIYGGARVL